MELSNKTLLMLLRSTDNFIFASRSTDRGKHWSQPVKTSVNNPDSKVSAMRLSSGLHVLAFNDHFRAFTGHAKVTLTSALTLHCPLVYGGRFVFAFVSPVGCGEGWARIQDYGYMKPGDPHLPHPS